MLTWLYCFLFHGKWHALGVTGRQDIVRCWKCGCLQVRAKDD